MDNQITRYIEKPCLNVKPGTNPTHIPVEVWEEIPKTMSIRRFIRYTPHNYRYYKENHILIRNSGGKVYLVSELVTKRSV